MKNKKIKSVKYVLPRNPIKLWEFFSILNVTFWCKVRKTIKYTFIKLKVEIREDDKNENI